MMKEDFNRIYHEILNSGERWKMKLLGGVMKQMFSYLDEHDAKAAQEMLDILEAANWENYLTSAEAGTILDNMQPAPLWDKRAWENMMNSLDARMEDKPDYNKCALFINMCKIDSDSRKSICKLMGIDGVKPTDVEYFKAVHMLAIDELDDEDGVFNIREYFKHVLWP